ncbi:MAG: hypothetical protein C4532_06350 [Candidatus Abyssobacteria bacterium SURF_17]|uniref:Uncharacterized protein n=1 Tax=Candidatus Abyssobacteria bacterium SURF_17 TaxID=2093361 RepID=A0A419F240_9BACT|nr:MAG: hypothetical protein C4532_06350 [Candidatus Abyssubacteria bacterium SURF_17]
MEMSRKKNKKQQSRDCDKSKRIPTPPDPRAMEKIFADMHRHLEGKNFKSMDEINAYLKGVMNSGELEEPTRALTPLEQAQELMYEAYELKGPRRVKLARQALQISPDCADAYVLLAEEASASLKEAKDLYAQGVEAGKRALDPEMFVEDVGHFWGLIETRPYMRARAGLAACLWDMGNKEEATEHYMDMLRLNPGDNQGIRYEAAKCLLVLGRYEELEKLFDAYKEGSAIWLYHRALFAFAKSGDTPEAGKLLDRALHANPHVPLYLFGNKKMPKHEPHFYGMGDENEAIIYVSQGIEAWASVDGAIVWLANKIMRIGEIE